MGEVVRIVSLWIHPGQEQAFEAFEREAASIMAVHGGRIERAIGPQGGEGESPYEVHVVVFGRVPMSGVRAGARFGPRRRAGPVMLLARPAD